MKLICDCGKEMSSNGGRVGGTMSISNFICECGNGIMAIHAANKDDEFAIRKVDPNEHKYKEEKIKKMLECFSLANIHVENYFILENEYNHDQFSPWLLVSTSTGFIKIGWRKRGIKIDWSETKIRKIISDDEVTNDETSIHAWSYIKAAEYLSNLKRHIDFKRIK